MEGGVEAVESSGDGDLTDFVISILGDAVMKSVSIPLSPTT